MSNLQLSDIIKHARDRSYMSGVQRDQWRIKATGEIFTPTLLVNEIIDQMPKELFVDQYKTFLDNSCGDGQFLSEILIHKLENVAENGKVTLQQFTQALSTIYGVDLMPDNIEVCKERLLCGRLELRHIVDQNIVQADGLRYHYRFDGSHPYDEEARKIEEQKLRDRLFVTV